MGGSGYGKICGVVGGGSLREGRMRKIRATDARRGQFGGLGIYGYGFWEMERRVLWRDVVSEGGDEKDISLSPYPSRQEKGRHKYEIEVVVVVESS